MSRWLQVWVIACAAVWIGFLLCAGTREHGVDVEYARAQARYAPLLALPGVDTSLLRDRIQELSTLRSDLADLQKASADKSLLLSALYPTDFLGELAQLQDFRLRFILTGSLHDLLMYESAERRAIDSYKRDIAALIRAIETRVPSVNATFVQGNVVVSKLAQITLLEDLEQSAIDLEVEAHERRLCVRGYRSRCTARHTQAAGFSTSARLALDKEMMRQARSVQNTLQESSPSFRQDGTILYVLSSSVCAPGRPALFGFYEFTSQDGETYFRPYYINDIRLMHTSRFLAVPFYKYFADHGIEYVTLPYHAHYACPEFRTDLSAVFSLSMIRSFARDRVISSYAEGERRKRLENLEQKLSAEVVHEYDAEAYLQEVAAVVRESEIPDDTRVLFDELVLSRRNATAGFEHVLKGLVETERSNVRMYKKGLYVDLEAPYLLFFRSAPLFFFGISPWVDAQTHTESLPEGAQNPYVSFSSITTLGDENKVVRDLARYMNVHDAPSSVPLDKSLDY